MYLELCTEQYYHTNKLAERKTTTDMERSSKKHHKKETKDVESSTKTLAFFSKKYIPIDICTALCVVNSEAF